MRRDRPSAEHLRRLAGMGLSVSRMAERTGWSAPTLRAWLKEAGIAPPRPGKRIGAWGNGYRTPGAPMPKEARP